MCIFYWNAAISATGSSMKNTFLGSKTTQYVMIGVSVLLIIGDLVGTYLQVFEVSSFYSLLFDSLSLRLSSL